MKLIKLFSYFLSFVVVFLLSLFIVVYLLANFSLEENRQKWLEPEKDLELVDDHEKDSENEGEIEGEIDDNVSEIEKLEQEFKEKFREKENTVKNKLNREKTKNEYEKGYDYQIVFYITEKGLIEDIRLLRLDIDGKSFNLASICKEKSFDIDEERLSLKKLHSKGKGPLVKRAVEKIKGIKPHFYVSIKKENLKEFLAESENLKKTGEKLKENPEKAYAYWRKIQTDISPIKAWHLREQISNPGEFSLED